MQDRRNLTPAGLLQDAPPPRTLAEVLGQKPRFEVIAGPLSLCEADLFRALVVDGHTAAEAMLIVRPRAPARWRWWRDPVVIGAAFAAAAMLAAIGIWGGW